ncbi:response regulator transcription factor [Nonomuraea sp. NPDC050404]|uniref:response regulator transcription factor n=1 Tax=Nonomuraea sp. NPDC050404 TaxID=3155783 RepID=UPI0034079C8E
MPDEPLTVLIVDDHPMFRQGLRHVLDTDPGLRVAGEAGDLATAYELVRQLRPQVVLMDLCLPDGSGIEATRRLTTDADAAPAVLVLTMSDTDDTVVAALRAGARGYLVKDAGAEDILRAVHTVARGGASLGPRTAERLSAFFTAVHSVPCREAFPTLTAREREILDLLARGFDNRRIARALVLSEKTIRNNVSRLLDKLHVPNRAQAAIRAREAGLGG